MEPKQALQLLAQAAAAYKGTLQEHESLQAAVEAINGIVNPPEPEKPSK